MSDESIFMDFDPNDFLIRLHPIMDKNGYWNGDISVGIITTPENDMDDEDFDQMMYLTMMVTSSIPLMEENAAFRTALTECAKRFHSEEEEEEPPKKPVTEKISENVIKVKF